MALLIIKVEVDLDPRLEDPAEVASDLLFDPAIDNQALRQYAEGTLKLVDAEWSA